MSSCLYEILEVSENATEDEIKKAYRRLSLQYHPDRNPTPEANSKMQEINTAYQTLSNKQTKQQYDFEKNGGGIFNGGGGEYGGGGGNVFFHREFSMDGGTVGGMEFADLFSMMFGGGGGGGGGDMRQAQQHIFQQLNKPPPIICNILLSLKQLYNGGTYPIEIEKWNLNINEIREVKKETIQITIPAGTNKGEIIVLRNCGNSININEEQIKGDVKIIINEGEGSDKTGFERNDMDLIFKKKISLKEALCGFSFDFTHLNGNSYTIRNTTSIVLPNQKQIIPNLGMKKDNTQGNLIVVFEVAFPTSLDSSKIDILREIL